MKLRPFSVIFGSGLAVLAAVACSSSSSNGSSGSGDLSTSSGFIDTYCSYVGSCCGSESLPSNGEQCRALLSFASGTYDAKNGQACIDAVKAASASDASWCVDSPSTTTACNAAFPSKTAGTVQPGGTCTGDTDCIASGSGDTAVCTFAQAGGSAQICVDEKHGKAGDGPCFGTVSTASGGITTTQYNTGATTGAGTAPEIFCFVADGVSCDQTSSTCTALAQIGDACTNTQCVAGAHCQFTNETCVANLAAGATCSQDSDCITGNYCSTGGKVCTAQGGTGAACAGSSQCTSSNCNNGSCGASFGTAFGLALLCGGDGGT